MPRANRSRQRTAEAAAAAAAKAGGVSGWLDAETAERTWRNLCGQWRDHMDNTYTLYLDKEDVMVVHTTRPRGKVLKTRGIVRIEWKDDCGRVVWGRAGAPALFTLAQLGEDSLSWQSSRAKPFYWDREEHRDEDEPEAKESGPNHKENPENEWAWNAAYSGAGWDDEGWEEVGWQDDDWEEYDEANDAAQQRRVQLRRQLQEARWQSEPPPPPGQGGKGWSQWQGGWERPARKKASSSVEEAAGPNGQARSAQAAARRGQWAPGWYG
mmetsp:Transcript_68913/g.190778  ORF Transcript_68913/g.190778 Transcript_68913/m.190778 type:complete len:268 (-) Transcript_68913:319-1122(-)